MNRTMLRRWPAEEIELADLNGARIGDRGAAGRERNIELDVAGRVERLQVGAQDPVRAAIAVQIRFHGALNFEVRSTPPAVTFRSADAGGVADLQNQVHQLALQQAGAFRQQNADAWPRAVPSRDADRHEAADAALQTRRVFNKRIPPFRIVGTGGIL